MNNEIRAARRPHVALATLVVCAAALALARAGGAVGYDTDPSGDSAGAPDITGVTIQSDAAGQILFKALTSWTRTRAGAPEADQSDTAPEEGAGTTRTRRPGRRSRAST